MIDLKIINKILKNSFAKNVILVAGGTVSAQVINVLATPIITRIFPPEVYGVLTVYTAILGLLSIASSLKYEWGIPIAKDDKKAINVVALSCIVLVVFVAIITLCLLVNGGAFLELLQAEDLQSYWIYIPIGIFFVGLYSIFTQWAYRRQDFKSISKTKLSQCVGQNLTYIGFGVINYGAPALMLGRILGQSAGIITLLRPFMSKDKELLREISVKEIKYVAKRYIKFPLFSSFSQFLNTASVQLPVLLLALLYGDEVIGFYGLANSIISIPTELIGTSVGDVFYGEATRIAKTEPEKLKRLSVILLKKLILIGLIPLITVLLFGPQLFTFIFGVEWMVAGKYAKIISFVAYTRLIFIPMSRIFSVFEKQKTALLLDGLRVLLIVLVFWLSHYLNLNAFWAITLYAASLSFVYLFTFLCAQNIMNYASKNLSHSQAGES